MKRILMIVLLCALLNVPAYGAQEIEIETEILEEGLSEEAQGLLPEISPQRETDFGESLKYMLFGALAKSAQSMKSGLRLCAVLLCVVTLCAMVELGSGKNGNTGVQAAGALGISAMMLSTFQAMLSLSVTTVREITDYSTLLLPIMASVSAMSGGFTSSTALYVGTVVFSQILLRLISGLLVPAVYFYLAISTAEAALSNDMLSELREFVGWLISKILRILIYVFMGYISVTGVISGGADAAAIKATKAAVSGMIPVVGSILSDASETMLASASLLKNTIGVFGMLAIIATCLLPIFRIGIQYLMMKVTAAISGTVGHRAHVNLLKNVSTAMGYLLAMCGVSCLMLLISMVCFMRVVS